MPCLGLIWHYFNVKLHIFFSVCLLLELQSVSMHQFVQIPNTSVTKHTSHNTKANNSKRSGNKKSVIILGDSMTKLLNGWEMAKRIQFSRATVSCMEDYMKPH